MKYEETASLARRALEASGVATHEEFSALFGGAIGVRTLRAWLGGERPASALAAFVLTEFVAGWRPRGAK